MFSAGEFALLRILTTIHMFLLGPLLQQKVILMKVVDREVC